MPYPWLKVFRFVIEFRILHFPYDGNMKTLRHINIPSRLAYIVPKRYWQASLSNWFFIIRDHINTEIATVLHIKSKMYCQIIT